MITLEINDDEIRAALAAMAAAVTDMSPAMATIADMLRDQSQDRFASKTGPDGTPWAARSAVTVAAYERRAKKKEGPATWGGVMTYTGQLGGKLSSASGADYAAVNSPEHYAAMMQFGGTKSRFPNLWGDIPARPFFGLSEDNKSDVLDALADWFAQAKD